MEEIYARKRKDRFLNIWDEYAALKNSKFY